MNSNPYVNPQRFLKALREEATDRAAAQIRYLLQTMPSPQGSPSMSLGEYTGKEVPLVPGSLRVYRDWMITPDGYLHALHWPQVWGKAEGNEAHCAKVPWGPYTPALTSAHVSPDIHCSCGFYGKYVPEDMGYIHGVAEFSGRIILGTKGARAQYAKPVAVNLNRVGEVLPLLKSNYPDLKLFPNNQDMYKEFPPQDVSELIPKPEPERIIVQNAMGVVVFDARITDYFKDAS